MIMSLTQIKMIENQNFNDQAIDLRGTQTVLVG